MTKGLERFIFSEIEYAIYIQDDIKHFSGD